MFKIRVTTHTSLSALTASTDELKSQYGESYAMVREALNGMLVLYTKYHIRRDDWQQFSHDVVTAFSNPVFGALQRVRDASKVVVYIV